MATRKKPARKTVRKTKKKGESPCKKCKPIKHSPARKANGQFKKKAK